MKKKISYIILLGLISFYILGEIKKFYFEYCRGNYLYEMQELKAGYTTCYDNYCEGEFPCLPEGACEFALGGLCIPSPMIGCFGEHPPKSTRHCTWRPGYTRRCKEGEREVIVEGCIDFCEWKPFLVCRCKSIKGGGAYIIKLKDCWYE